MTTTTTPVLQAWATRPIGKAARIAIAALGMVLATLVIMSAAVVESGSWALVVLGVALCAASVRAARVPSGSRIAMLAVIAIAIPLSIQVF